MSYFWASVWTISFALCMYLERNKLAVVKRNRGWFTVALLVVTALMVAPALLMQTFADKLFTRSVETEKL